jgi:hypothetical protein
MIIEILIFLDEVVDDEVVDDEVVDDEMEMLEG